MKSYRKELHFKIPERRGVINITENIQDAINKSGIKEGIVLVNSMNTMCSVFIGEDDEALHNDIDNWLERLAPEEPHNQYIHNGFDNNADAHLKRSIMGREVVCAITKGRLDFGTWEQIFFYEFDGRHKHHALVKIIGE